MRTCDLCEKPHHANGLCNSHNFIKWQKANRDKVNATRRKWDKNHREYNTKRLKEYRGTARGKQVARNAVKKYESTHPKRKFAWNKANKIPIKPCEVCGSLPVHRHHPDVSKPLEIIFLCPLHHKQQHML